MIEYSFTSVQGNAQNEDMAMASPQFGFIIDGASGLSSEKITPAASDAQWFAHGLGRLLAQCLGDLSQTIESHVAKACDVLLAEYFGYLEAQGLEYDLEALPNATLSVVRLNQAENRIDCFQLGDSPILLEESGQLIILDDERLAASDQRALTKMIEIAKDKQLSLREARLFVTDLLLANRQRRNTPAGYWILDPTGQGLKGARQVTVPYKRVSRLVIMSDGLWEAYDILQMYESPNQLFERVFSDKGLAALIAEMRHVQRADPTFNQYPRFKLMDDASVVRYNF